MPEIVKRRPGRPKGARNKATRDIKELAMPYAPEALRTLRSIMTTSENHSARVAAAKELLDRAYGKAPQRSDVTITERMVVEAPLYAPDADAWASQHRPH